MISDLKADSQRWRQEQRSTGTRGSPQARDRSGSTEPDMTIESYVGSQAYHHNNSTRPAPRRDADSPKLDGSYVAPPSRDRMPPSVINGVQPGLPRHASERGYQPERERERERYEPTRGYPPERNYPSERYDRDTAMTGMPTGYNRQPVTSAYGQDPVYASQYPPQPSNDGAPPGYIRQGEYYIPDPGYGRGQPPSRSEAPQYGQSQYGQLPRGPEVRDPRDARDPREMRDPRDPRYGQPAGYGQPDYQDPRDPRYAYPSPAATVSSITARDREPVTGPSQPRFASRCAVREESANSSSIYGSAPQYDQYGRRKYR